MRTNYVRQSIYNKNIYIIPKHITSISSKYHSRKVLIEQHHNIRTISTNLSTGVVAMRSLSVTRSRRNLLKVKANIYLNMQVPGTSITNKQVLVLPKMQVMPPPSTQLREGTFPRRCFQTNSSMSYLTGWVSATWE